MPTQKQQIAFTILSRLQRKNPPTIAAVAEHGEQAGRRIDPDLFTLALDRIRPDGDQVRRMNKSATDAEIKELAETIRSVGVLQPIDVRYIASGDYFEIVAGERRFTAAKLAGLDRVPVKRLYVDDAEARRLQLIENVHRADLSPLELGIALQELVDSGTSPEQLSQFLFKSKSYVTKALGIARNLSKEARKEVTRSPERFRSMAHLYEVSLLPSDQQKPVLTRIADDGLTRTELQTLVADVKKQRRESRSARGGRPASASSFTKTFDVDEATITVRFQKTHVKNSEIANALRKLLRVLIK